MWNQTEVSKRLGITRSSKDHLVEGCLDALRQNLIVFKIVDLVPELREELAAYAASS
jgi:hypothetical protein